MSASPLPGIWYPALPFIVWVQQCACIPPNLLSICHNFLLSSIGGTFVFISTWGLTINKMNKSAVWINLNHNWMVQLTSFVIVSKWGFVVRKILIQQTSSSIWSCTLCMNRGMQELVLVSWPLQKNLQSLKSNLKFTSFQQNLTVKHNTSRDHKDSLMIEFAWWALSIQPKGKSLQQMSR